MSDPFIEVGYNEREDVAPRTANGMKGLRFPAAASGVEEFRIALPGCSNCTKSATHGPPCSGVAHTIPFGAHRHAHVTETNRFPASFLHRLAAAFFSIRYAFQGVVYDVLFNAGLGTANNVSQEWGGEIVAVSGNTITVRMLNPKKLTTGQSRVNPDWPLPDPVTGGLGRLVTEGYTHVLPPGSLVRFNAPSVLAGKLEPYIKRVHPPVSTSEGTVEFDIDLNCHVSSALSPINAKYPPANGTYYCTIFAYSTFPEPWPNFQPPIEAQFVRRSVTRTRAQLVTASWLHYFKDTADQNTRVLLPTMLDPDDDALVVTYKRTGQAEATVPNATARFLVTTQQTGATAWTSHIDLSSLNYGDLEYVRLDYHCERLSGDEDGLVFAGSCANSQVDWTESYVHDGTRRCMNVDCSGFANYHATCWQPNASGFALGIADDMWEGGGEIPFPATDPLLAADWIANLWMGVSLVLIQGNVGQSQSRNFAIQRRGLAGVAELLGTHNNGVYSGLFEKRDRWFGPSLGVRTETSDPEAGADHAITYGAFVAAVEQDAAAAAISGSLSAAIDDWESAKDFSGEVALYPTAGVGTTSLYEQEVGGLSVGKVARGGTNEEVFATAMDTTLTLEAVETLAADLWT